jgi:FlaA1/EpsC-like NDP-sugar epimerase
MQNVDIVFHAAALKHVPSCEYNPFEAVKTNVLGTQNITEAAMENSVQKVITVSTDKATNPINTMGATKLLSERLMVAAEYMKGDAKTIFSAVRFGNVISSRGSIVPLFTSQVKKGGPVTITDPNMTRFMMLIYEAVNLILKSAELMLGGEIFILKMPVLKLGDLADVIIAKNKSKDVSLKIIGMRPGEKLCEDLMTHEEASKALETEDMYIVLPHINLPHFSKKKYRYPNAKNLTTKAYCSESNRLLTKKEIHNLLYS